MIDLRERLQEVFQSVFDDADLVLRDEMTARDVAGWDSLTHINLIIAVEQAFGITFATVEISRMKEPGQDIGHFLRTVESKVCG